MKYTYVKNIDEKGQSTQNERNSFVRLWYLWEKIVGKVFVSPFVALAKYINIRQGTDTKGSFFQRRWLFVFSATFILITFPLVYLLTAYQSIAEAAWFNDNWQYRQKVTYVNSSTAITSARKVKLDIDTATLITAGTLQSDCDDLRFTDINGKLLDYYLDTSGGACNTSSTDVYILVASVPEGTNTTYMYYGNPSALAGTVESQFSESTYTPDSGPTFGSEEISEGPVAYWKLDEGVGSTAQDTTQSDNDGTITDATWKQEDFCKAGKCLEFDGDEDYITRSDDADFDFAASDDFTITGWFRHGIQTSGQDVLIAKTSSSAGYKILMESDGDITFAIDDDATWTPDDSATSTAATYDDNQWHHFSAVKDSTTSITLYIDGVQVAQDSSIAATGTLANSAALYIGIDGDGTSNDWDGFLDDIKVYRYARSAAQVKQDALNAGSASGAAVVLGEHATNNNLTNGLVGYWNLDETSGTRADSSGSNNNLTDSSTVPSTKGVYGLAADFESSTSEYMQITDNPSLSMGTGVDMSICAWVQLESEPTNDMYIAEKWNGQNEYVLYWDWINQEYRFTWRTAGGTFYTLESNTFGTTSTGEWNHVCATVNTGTRKGTIYVDGGNADTWNINDGPRDSTANFTVGSQNGSQRFWDGPIDELRVYKRALSAKEVTQLYNHTPGPSVHYDLENTGTNESLDQENDTGGSASLGGADRWQSFTPAISGDVTKIEWYNPTGTDCDASLILRSGQGTGGSSLASEAIEQRNSGWEEFTFSTPGAVNSGSEYTLHFDIDDCHIGDYSGANPYAGGRASLGANHDYQFRVYVEYEGLADLSGNGNLALINNFSGTYEVKGKYGFAYDFDGSDDSLSLSSSSDSYVDFNDTESFSGSAWVKIDTMPGSSNQDAIIAKWDETSTLRGYRLVVENDDGDSTGNFQVEVYDESANQAITASGSNDTVNEDEWYYVHFTFNGGTSGTAGDLKLYVNALLTDENSANGSFAGLENIAADFSIGNYDSTDVIVNNTAFDGIIDDVKIFWYESPTRDIISAYNDNHPLGGSPIASQIGYWSLDEQQGQTAYDRGYGENNATLGASTSENTDDPAWKTPSDCKMQGCAEFDGGDFISLADTNELDFNAADLSVSAWVYHDTVSGTDTIIDKRNSTSEGYHLTNVAGTWTFVIEEVSSGDHCTVTSTTKGSTTSEWIHVAANYNSDSGTCKLFINGIEVADTTSSSNPSGIDASNSQSMRIGSDDGSTNFWDGKIDEVKIYAAALTQEEVLIDMNGGSALNFGVLGASEASLLTDGAGDPPVAEWRFDEGIDDTCTGGTNDICDVSGNGYDGTVTGATWTSSTHCQDGKCLTFDGSGDYIDIGTGPSSVESVSFWAYPTTTTEYFIDLNGTAYVWASSGIVTTTGFTSPTIYVNGTETSSISANEWSHVTVTTTTGINASDIDIGRLEGTDDFDGRIDHVKLFAYDLTASQAAYDYNRGRPIAHYKLDECSGSTAHSSTEPYDSNLDGTLNIGGSGTNDDAGSCDSGDSSEAWNNGTTGKYGAGLDFDGTDDYIEISDTDELNPGKITVSTWFNKNGSGNSGHTAIIGKWDNTTADRSYWLGDFNDNETIDFCVSSSGSNYLCRATASFSENEWYHVIATWDGTSVAIYINGIEQQLTTTSSSGTVSGDLYNDDSALRIGATEAQSSNPNYMNGQVDDVRIYNYSLSENQIKQIYNNGSSVSFGQ